jgi:hypothetical protein
MGRQRVEERLKVILWWEKVEWLQEPRLQGKETRQGRVRAAIK